MRKSCKKEKKRSTMINLILKIFTSNKKFWNTMKPLCSDKSNSSNKITLIEGDTIISDDITVAETMNNYFTNVVKELQIKGFKTEDISDEQIELYLNLRSIQV